MKEISRAGKYEILERIGVGGFGTVYRGRDPFIKRTVAIKTCSTEDEGIRRRFLREAEIAGSLQHPNITLLYDFGYEDGIPYLVQEFLSGVDMQHLIDRRADITVETKIDYLRQTASGLLFAHENGVLHRDIKPSNLRLLDDGRVKILDFGIAKLASQETKLTHTGITLGTPAYLAPEQLRGEEVDPRADIYSFGVVAFELLTYERMFDATSISALFYQILNEQGRKLSEVWQVAPAPLETFLQRCTALDRDERFPTFREVLEELDGLQGALPGSMPTATIDPGATAVLSPDLIESAIEQERASKIEKARSAVMKHVDEGNLAEANVQLARAVEKFGEIAPLRTLSERIAEVEKQITESDRRRRINSALDEVEAHLAQGDLTSAEIRLSELEAEVPDRKELPDLRSRLDAAVANAESQRLATLAATRSEIEGALERGDLTAAERAMAVLEAAGQDATMVAELSERLDQARLAQRVETAAAEVSAALAEQRLDDAEIALEEARAQLGTHPNLARLAADLVEARRRSELDGEVGRIRSLLGAGQLDDAETAIADLREAEAERPELADLQRDLAAARNRQALAQVSEEVSRALAGESVDPAEQLLAAAVGQYGEQPELTALAERIEDRRRELALQAAVVRIEEKLEQGSLDDADRELAAARDELGPRTRLDLLQHRLAALRMEKKVAAALDAVAKALGADALDDARGILERSRAELGDAVEEHERFPEIGRLMEEKLAADRARRAAIEIERTQAALAEHQLSGAIEHARLALEIDPGNAEARALFQTAENARARELEAARRAESQRATALATEALLDSGKARAAHKRLRAGLDDHGYSEELEELERRVDEARAAAPAVPPVLLYGGVAALLVLGALAVWLMTRGGDETPVAAGEQRLEVLAVPWAKVVAVRDTDDRDYLPSLAEGESHETPLVLSLPPGTYTLTLELPDGERETREVVVADGPRREIVTRAPIDVDSYFEAAGYEP